MIGLKKEEEEEINVEKKKKRLTCIRVGLVFELKFLLIIFLYCTCLIKYLYFFGEKSKMQQTETFKTLTIFHVSTIYK